ncbi:MAG TPA: flagellar basal body-associated FliL family protein [Syntrophorhabdaceae bacterium]|nr:flagellar basal body-associated FliL family protein [Syntrophorhabdaceae bacterium]
MAEDQKQEKIADAEAAPEDENRKSSLSKIIVLAIIFVVLGGGGGVGYYLYGQKVMNKLLHKESTDSQTQDKQEGQEKKKEAVGPILSLDPFIFNMSGNQSKYAKVTLGVEVKDLKAMEEIKKITPVVRDRILSILGTKTPEILMDVSQRTAIKDEIQKNLKTSFEDGEAIKAVYITDIIIQ